MEGDIHCLLGWVGALARPSPAIFRNYRSLNPGITMTALGLNPGPPAMSAFAPLLRDKRTSNAPDPSVPIYEYRTYHKRSGSRAPAVACAMILPATSIGAKVCPAANAKGYSRPRPKTGTEEFIQ
jgi:hypothetical protein